MFNKKSVKKNGFQLNGLLKRNGYDWWWHSFTAYNRQTGEEKAFYIEFFIMNPELCRDKIILGQDKNSKEKALRPTYLMVNVGSWGKNKKQLHRFFSLSETSICKCPISIKAGNCFLDENSTYGEVEVDAKDVKSAMMTDVGRMKWNIKIKKEIAWNVGYGTSKFFRMINAFEMYWHAEGMKTSFEGEIEYDGEMYDVIPEKSYGYADKNWGRDFTSPWVWLSSSHLRRKSTNEELLNSAFDIGGGKPKVFGISLPRKLLSGYYIEGKEIEMNFSKIFHPCETWFKFKEEKDKVFWRVIQENKSYKIEVDISCLKKDMLFINYESPKGLKLHNRLFNGGNGIGNMKIFKKKKKEYILIDEIECYNVGCEYGEFSK